MRVTCAVIFLDGKILATQRGPKMKLPYLWEFPGGKVEAGESEAECISRELKEELNINVKLKGKLNECSHQYDDFEITLIPFLADYKSGTLTLSEHMNYIWLSPDELHTLNWAPADVDIVNQIIAQVTRDK